MMEGTATDIFIFVALGCEAKPVIRHYELKKRQDPHPFPIYRGGRVTLIVSGVGKSAMAGAVGYAMGLFRPNHPLMINFGIAGQRHADLGSLLMADKVFYADDSTKTFYPQLIGRVPCPTLPLCTLSKPDFEYADDCLYDMEGAAFYEMAVKFSSKELIHCLKIISDNRHEPAENINADKVGEWVGMNMETTAAVIEQLASLRRHLNELEPALFQELTGRYRFSVSGRIKLKALLNRWHVVSGGRPLAAEDGFANAKQFLKWLEAHIDEQDFRL